MNKKVRMDTSKSPSRQKDLVQEKELVEPT